MRYEFVQEYYISGARSSPDMQMSELRTQEQQLQADLDIAKRKLDTETKGLKRHRSLLEENKEELLKAKAKKDMAKFGNMRGSWV